MYYHDEELLAEIKKASTLLAAGDARIDAIERAINQVMVRQGRPGLAGDGFDGGPRASAIELCKTRHELLELKDAGKGTYEPGASEIEDAIQHRKALGLLWRTGDPAHLPNEGSQEPVRLLVRHQQFHASARAERPHPVVHHLSD